MLFVGYEEFIVRPKSGSVGLKSVRRAGGYFYGCPQDCCSAAFEYYVFNVSAPKFCREHYVFMGVPAATSR
jgi:hypothetical protein